MPYIEEAYSPDKMENLLQYLQCSKEQGEPEDFEIWVDAFKVVKRTNDTDRFENYTNYMRPETKSVSILIYDGTSPRNTKHTFILKDDKQALSGLEINNRIDDRLKTEKEKWESELLKRDYEKLKIDYEESEKYVDELEEKLLLAIGNKPRINEMGVVEVASVLLEGFVRRNPRMLAKLPGGEALAGAFIEDNEEKTKLLNAAPEPDAKVSFKMEGEETKETLSEEDKTSLEFIKQLNATFNREQMTQVFLILDVFAKRPEAIDKTVQYLSEQTKS
ncbi:MAG TPA: hypothetical protein VK835_08725 [Bacteroidia bacterium]|jgi:hypothetical protein|nr:hypothetical protein [Bacteroidia bacterium]